MAKNSGGGLRRTLESHGDSHFILGLTGVLRPRFDITHSGCLVLVSNHDHDGIDGRSSLEVGRAECGPEPVGVETVHPHFLSSRGNGILRETTVNLLIQASVRENQPGGWLALALPFLNKKVVQPSRDRNGADLPIFGNTGFEDGVATLEPAPIRSGRFGFPQTQANLHKNAEANDSTLRGLFHVREEFLHLLRPQNGPRDLLNLALGAVPRPFTDPLLGTDTPSEQSTDQSDDSIAASFAVFDRNLDPLKGFGSVVGVVVVDHLFHHFACDFRDRKVLPIPHVDADGFKHLLTISWGDTLLLDLVPLQRSFLKGWDIEWPLVLDPKLLAGYRVVEAGEDQEGSLLGRTPSASLDFFAILLDANPPELPKLAEPVLVLPLGPRLLFCRPRNLLVGLVFGEDFHF